MKRLQSGYRMSFNNRQSVKSLGPLLRRGEWEGEGGEAIVANYLVVEGSSGHHCAPVVDVNGRWAHGGDDATTCAYDCVGKRGSQVTSGQVLPESEQRIGGDSIHAPLAEREELVQDGGEILQSDDLGLDVAGLRARLGVEPAPRDELVC